MRVTIVIPQTLEYLRFYEKAVESVQEQTRPASLVTINADGMSVGKATNLGVAGSESEYVMRLDCDDWLHEYAIQIMVNYLDAHPGISAVYSDYWHADEHGHASIVGHQSVPPHPGCMLIRRSAYDEVKGFDESLDRQEGTDFYYRLAKKFKIGHIPLPLWYYRRHSSNMSSAHNEVVQARHEVKDKHQQEGERILCIVPARGGSKGVPRKNLIRLNGLPLVTRAIRMAKASRHDMVIVLSTEDEEIAKVAADEGVALLRRRPGDAEDEVSLVTVAKHVMEDMDSTFRADIVVTIQPTACFTPTEALDKALDRMLAVPTVGQLDAVVCVAEEVLGKHPYRLYSRVSDSKFTPFFPRHAEAYLQRQDREAAYQFTGGFYCRRRWLLEAWQGEGFALGRWEGEVVGRNGRWWEGLDIDSEPHLILAQHAWMAASPPMEEI